MAQQEKADQTTASARAVELLWSNEDHKTQDKALSPEVSYSRSKGSVWGTNFQRLD